MIRSQSSLKAHNGRLWMMLALPAAAAATALVVGCSSSGTSSGGSSSGGSGQAAGAGSLKTAMIGGATVLTNGKGFTLYSFGPDTPTTSNCNGACAQNWPPVKGPVTAPGVKGTFGTKGFTLYSFAPDTPTASKCYGNCAVYWPPVTGTAVAGSGLPGRISTIKRSDGSRQLTYNGHPLYTYIGDSAPGQARGNNLNLYGGLWREVHVSR